MWNREVRHDQRAALFGGRESVRVWDLLGRARAEPFRAVLACELDPGGSVGRHVQEELDEIVIVLDGFGEASVDGARTALAPGAVVPLRLGQVLAIENGSSEAPLRYLIVKATAAPR